VRLVLPVVLDDLLGARTAPAGRGLSTPTEVPPDARALLRRRIRRNEFAFDELLLSGVPLVRGGSAGGGGAGGSAGGGLLRRLLRGPAAPAGARAPAQLAALRLLEDGGRWAVDMTWGVAGAAARQVDQPALARELDAQLSDGWGEGVEQMRFGPLVACEDRERTRGCRVTTARTRATQHLDPTTHGRFAFTLTTAAAPGGRAHAHWTPVVRVSSAGGAS
jgi:hypothetical protein